MQSSGCPCSVVRDVRNFTAGLVRKKWPRYKEQHVRKISLKVTQDAVAILKEEERKRSRRNSIGTSAVPLQEDVLRKFISRHLEDLVAGTYKRDITVAQVYKPAKKNLSDEQKYALENKLHLALFDEERKPPPVKKCKLDFEIPKQNPSFRLLHTISEAEEETQKGQIDSLIRRLSGIGIAAKQDVNVDRQFFHENMKNDRKSGHNRVFKDVEKNTSTVKNNATIKTNNVKANKNFATKIHTGLNSTINNKAVTKNNTVPTKNSSSLTKSCATTIKCVKTVTKNHTKTSANVTSASVNKNVLIKNSGALRENKVMLNKNNVRLGKTVTEKKNNAILKADDDFQDVFVERKIENQSVFAKHNGFQDVLIETESQNQRVFTNDKEFQDVKESQNQRVFVKDNEFQDMFIETENNQNKNVFVKNIENQYYSFMEIENQKKKDNEFQDDFDESENQRIFDRDDDLQNLLIETENRSVFNSSVKFNEIQQDVFKYKTKLNSSNESQQYAFDGRENVDSVILKSNDTQQNTFTRLCFKNKINHSATTNKQTPANNSQAHNNLQTNYFENANNKINKPHDGWEQNCTTVNSCGINQTEFHATRRNTIFGEKPSREETDDSKLRKTRQQKRSIDALFELHYDREDSYFRELQQLSAQFQELQKQMDRVRMLIKR